MRSLCSVICIFSSILVFCSKEHHAISAFPIPNIPFSPKHYLCYQTNQPPTIDGQLDEPIWQSADWTDDFVDIEGELKPQPRFRTRAKMLWDADYFYIGAELEEPDIWANLTQRDAVIFYDNDFEVFIDPDGDSHEYYEFEMNAFNTVWDLLLIRPYRDGGPAVNAWDIQGLKTGVFIDGTINQPGDQDKSWSVEIAMPWKVLQECAHRAAPPQNGDQWRVNFSRVEWRIEVKDGQYRKVLDPATGKPLPEDNWVWSPQGLINMHYPEMWGFVQFSDKIAGQGKDKFQIHPEEQAKWRLRQVYYQERDYFEQFGEYTDELSKLNLKKDDLNLPMMIHTTPNLFEASVTIGNQKLIIMQDGRIETKKIQLDSELKGLRKKIFIFNSVGFHFCGRRFLAIDLPRNCCPTEVGLRTASGRSALWRIESSQKKRFSFSILRPFASETKKLVGLRTERSQKKRFLILNSEAFRF